jgi:hypothetical protein
VCRAIKNSQRFATLVATIFLLFISTPIAPDPELDAEVFQSSSIKVTPSVLDYGDLKVGYPKATTLTVTNVSENDISITPSMSFGTKYAPYLSSRLEFCDSGACSRVNYATKTFIPKGGQKEFVVTVTLNGEFPNGMKASSIAGDLKVTGEILQ